MDAFGGIRIKHAACETYRAYVTSKSIAINFRCENVAWKDNRSRGLKDRFSPSRTDRRRTRGSDVSVTYNVSENAVFKIYASLSESTPILPQSVRPVYVCRRQFLQNSHVRVTDWPRVPGNTHVCTYTYIRPDRCARKHDWCRRSYVPERACRLRGICCRCTLAPPHIYTRDITSMRAI